MRKFVQLRCFPQMATFGIFLLVLGISEGNSRGKITLSKIITEDAKPVIWRKQQENITMNCTVLSGGPALRIMWIKNGKQVIASSKGRDWSALVLYKLKESHAGKYRCVVEGKTRDVSMVHLHVEGRPKIKFQRGFFSPTPTVVVVGETIYLHCFASGEPKPLFQWLINGKAVKDDPMYSPYALLPRENGLELKIYAISHREAGLYTCRCANRVGIAQYTVQVIVNDFLLPLPPELKAITPLVTAMQGKNATLSCTGKYVPKGYTFVFWMFKEQDINENKKYSITTDFYIERNTFATKMMANTSLTIRGTDWGDEGNYACVASSHFGLDKQQLQLMVSNKKGKSADVYRRY